MSISVVKEPSLVDLSGSSLPYWLSSNAIYSSVGSAAEAEIAFTAIPSNGDEIDIAFLDYEIRFDFETNPDNTGEEIGISGATVADWLNDVCIPALEANYDLDKFYRFYRAVNSLMIVAKNVGTDYNLSFPENTTSATITTTVGANPVFKSDFRILLLLEYTNMSNPTPTPYNRLEKVLNVVDDTAYFNLEETLYHLHENVLPDYGQTTVKNMAAKVLKYRGRFAEMYQEQSFTSKLQVGPWKYALPGGRQQSHYVNYSDFLNDWLNDGETKFLTHQLSQKVTKNQPVLVNYLHVNASASFVVKADLTYTDGTSETVDIFTLNPAKQYILYNIPLGYSIAQANAGIGKTVASWSAYIYFGGKISNTISLTLDEKPVQDEALLLYENSFGVHEIYRCTGEISNYTEFKRQVAHLHNSVPTNLSDRKTELLEAEQRNYFLINTGFKTKAEIDQLSEVIASRDVYLVQNGWFPVRIENNELARGATLSGRQNAAQLKITANWEKFYAHA